MYGWALNAGITTLTSSRSADAIMPERHSLHGSEMRDWRDQLTSPQSVGRSPVHRHDRSLMPRRSNICATLLIGDPASNELVSSNGLQYGVHDLE